jgi:hypothetical protein
MREKGKDFKILFMEAVDEGLSFLGESGRHMVLYHLERNYSIKRHEIPKNPEAFVAGLEGIFGAGASVLEKMILKSLYSKLGLKYEEKEGRTFTDCLKEVTVTVAQFSKNPEEMEEPNKSLRNFIPKTIESYQSASESQLCIDNEILKVHF